MENVLDWTGQHICFECGYRTELKFEMEVKLRLMGNGEYIV